VKTMKWSIEQLLSKRFNHEPFTFRELVDVSDLKDRDEQIRDISLVKVEGEGDITDQLASFHLHLTGKMVLPCARTLKDVDFPFTIDTIETFQLNDKAFHRELADNEEVHEVEGNTVDLLPYIKENILLEIPIQVLSPDAEMPSSGKGWEMADEKRDKPVDPRMAKLAEWFDHNEEDS